MASRVPPLCAQCQEKARDPMMILSEPFSIGGSLRRGTRLCAVVARPVAFVCLIFALPQAVISHLIQQSGGSLSTSVSANQLYGATVGLVGTLACLALMSGAAQGRRQSVGAALVEGLSAWGRVFVASLLANLKAALWSLLLIFPGIMKAMELAVVTPAAFLCGARVDSHARSSALTEGRRWPLLGVFVITWALMALVVNLVGVGVNRGMQIVTAPEALFLGQVLVAWAGILAESWLSAVTLAAYFGLCAEKR